MFLQSGQKVVQHEAQLQIKSNQIKKQICIFFHQINDDNNDKFHSTC